MKKKILLFSGLFLLLLCWFTPAKLIENMMPASMNAMARGFSGTVWSGRINRLSVEKLVLKKVDFSLSPLALLTGGIVVDLSVLKGDITGDFSLQVFELTQPDILVDNANLRLQANAIAGFIPISGIGLTGNVLTKDLLLHIENKKPSALAGDLVWKKAAVNFSGQEWELGDFSMRFSTNSDSKIITGQINFIKMDISAR